MTLSPVFRSPDAVKALKSRGYLKALKPALKLQRQSVERVRDLLRDVIEDDFIGGDAPASDEVAFVQENFFLSLFNSLFGVLDSTKEKRLGYAYLNVCIKGLVTSGDNLFDEEAKMDLPLSLGKGARFASIVQMLCFDHLVDRILEEHCGFFGKDERIEFKRALISRMARIGTLEGSEEGGVDAIPTVERMVESVHRVRGGELFALAFIAPAIGERRGAADDWARAEAGVRHLGTAFQIVDDVTDFEFDLGRRSHNIVAAHVYHHGAPADRETLGRWRSAEEAPPEGALDEQFAEHAAAILDIARAEAERGFAIWKDLGFWFPPEDADIFIRAIAGDAGYKRVGKIADRMGARARP